MARLILIIEDDPDIAEVLRYSLEAQRFETRVALTARKGFRLHSIKTGHRCLFFSI